MTNQVSLQIGPLRENSHSDYFWDRHLEIRTPHGVRISEKLLMGSLKDLKEKSLEVLILGSSEAILPMSLATFAPQNQITAFYHEKVDYQRATENAEKNHIESVNFVLAPPPLPEEKERFDRVFLPLIHTLELELIREWVLAAWRLLKVGGQLFVSVDTRKKHRVESILRKCFVSLKREQPLRHGQVWVGRKKAKDQPPNPAGFSTYQLKEGENLYEFQSQPGVFAHGRLDDGARALLKVLRVEANDFLLDLGCGAGELGIMAALREPTARVVLSDANSRAVQMAEHNAKKLLKEGQYEIRLAANFAEEYPEFQEKFSVVVTNPPYFSHYRISQNFLNTIQKVLHPEGRFYLVTKQDQWHRDAIKESFLLQEENKIGGYTLFEAKRFPM